MNIKKRYRTRFIFNIILAAFLTLLVESMFVFNINRLMAIFGATFEGNERNVILYVFSAVFFFALIFYLLEQKALNHIENLSRAMKDISDGKLDTKVTIEGDDEFSAMAVNLNTMASNLKELLLYEREAEKSKNDLITNIAHDLKTPLTSVIGYLELLSLDGSKNLTDGQRQRYITIAYNKSRRLEKLINDLFDYSKLSYGKINMKLGYVDIIKLLGQLLEESYPAFHEKGLSYELKTNVKSLEITADSLLMVRLFENLIGNAIKYGADGKKVIVRVNYDELGDLVEIKVINFGFVIEEKDLPFIFDKFYRGDKARSTQTGGTGLGLAIAKDIVDMHGGTISASSDLDGTVFTVRLKCHIEKNQEYLKRA